jgi:23S rRNA (pseudouridine1915-N3)-methyltransferase
LWVQEIKETMQYTITVVSLGKKNEALDEEIARYERLLRPWASLSLVLIKPSSAMEMPLRDMLLREGNLLRSKWPSAAYPVALSEEGRSMTSAVFSRWLLSLLQTNRNVVFTIGGAYGLSPELKKESRDLLSLSPLTFPHRLCMLVLVEQIYRAFTIFHHHPYHK